MSGHTKSLRLWRKQAPRKPVARGTTQVEACYLHIGSILLEMRERRGWPQARVADAMGWTRANVANVEAGRQRVMLHDLPRLAKALGVPVLDLLPSEFHRGGST